jgi:hypothetical protein
MAKGKAIKASGKAKKSVKSKRKPAESVNTLAVHPVCKI